MWFTTYEKDSSGGGDDGPITKTVTDYLGVTRTITKEVASNGAITWSDGKTEIKNEYLSRWDKTLNGTFYNDKNHIMENYNGATFNLTEIGRMPYDAYDIDSYTIKIYNADDSKLSIAPDSSVTIKGINTYKEIGSRQYAPTTRYYLYKNGKPIALTHNEEDNLFVYSKGTDASNSNLKTYSFGFYNSGMSAGYATGIYTDTFYVEIKYDGKLIARKQFDTTEDAFHSNWTVNTANYMSPNRRLALDIANEAIAANGGSTGNVEDDLTVITAYVNSTYKKNTVISGYGTSFNMSCIPGSLILETYAIIQYNEYGFSHSGNSYGTNHVAFSLNKNKMKYWNCQGY